MEKKLSVNACTLKIESQSQITHIRRRCIESNRRKMVILYEIRVHSTLDVQIYTQHSHYVRLVKHSTS